MYIVTALNIVVPHCYLILSSLIFARLAKRSSGKLPALLSCLFCNYKRSKMSKTRHRKRYNPLALYHFSYWSHCWMDTHFLMYLLRVLQHLNIKKNCDLDINHRPLKHEPIKDMFILSIGMATSLISLCFSIIGIRSRSQLLLEENFFHCSGLLIFRLNLTKLHTKKLYEVISKSGHK